MVDVNTYFGYFWLTLKIFQIFVVIMLSLCILVRPYHGIPPIEIDHEFSISKLTNTFSGCKKHVTQACEKESRYNSSSQIVPRTDLDCL